MRRVEVGLVFGARLNFVVVRPRRFHLVDSGRWRSSAANDDISILASAIVDVFHLAGSVVRRGGHPGLGRMNGHVCFHDVVIVSEWGVGGRAVCRPSALDAAQDGQTQQTFSRKKL